MAESEPIIEEEDLSEALDELKPHRNWADGAALWSTDWTAETVLSQLNRNNIDLNPSFQRRSAWQEDKQSLFIESLILGLPIPQLILADTQGKKGFYIVIDGKQRLLAIRRFCSTDSSGGFKPLKLKGLKQLKHLNGKTYADLVADLSLSEDRATFENSSIRTVVIRAWKDEEYLYEVFLRINTGSVKLSPQELRQALHPGQFSNFIDEASADAVELKRALGLSEPDFRMRDAEILLRFVAYRNFIQDYRGNLKSFLDETTKSLNYDWAIKEPIIRDHAYEMERALEFTRNVFTEKYYLRKWNGTEFEAKKNRAVFDIMLQYFCHPDVRVALQDKSELIVERFKELCTNNKGFRSALESTTKSVEANRLRFNIWADEVSQLSGVDLTKFRFPEAAGVV
jgi:hypothetical protein